MVGEWSTGEVECRDCGLCRFQLKLAHDKIERLEANIKAAILALRGTPHPPDWSEEPTPKYVSDVLEQALQ